MLVTARRRVFHKSIYQNLKMTLGARVGGGVEHGNGLTASLDGLRGLLAVWVLMSHATQFTAGPELIINRGGIAVDMFMFVSGFLMVWTVSARSHRESPDCLPTWKKFWIRRFLRIAPLYYFSLIFSWVFSKEFNVLLIDAYHTLGQDFDRPFRNCSNSVYADVLIHFSFLYGLFPCTAANNTLPDWSLSLEMQFYAVFPLLYLAQKRWSVLRVALFAMIVTGFSQAVVTVYGVRGLDWIEYPQASILPLRLNCFMLGMLVSYTIWTRKLNFSAYFGLLLLLLPFQRLLFVLTVSPFIVMLFSRAGLVFTWDSKLAKPFRLLDGFLQTRPLRFFGDISFGVYLVHIPLLLPLLKWLNGYSDFVSASGVTKFFTLLLIGLPVVFAVSWVLHIWIEQPMIRLAQHLTGKQPSPVH